uniref:cytochrome-b5 reductase n=1 Tax=Hucho hucho TaxID=62062 RepID=A0A4W5JYP3_9TELE
ACSMSVSTKENKSIVPLRGRLLLLSWSAGDIKDITVFQLCNSVSAQDVSHDTKRFRFGLPSSTHILGLPVRQHVHLSAKVHGRLVIRAYTPVSSDAGQGFVDLVVKVLLFIMCYKNTHRNYPDRGKMSQSLDAISIGDKIDFRGPNGLLVYTIIGKFAIQPDKKSEAKVRRNLMFFKCMCQITSMLQLIHSITAYPADDTKCSLIFANQTKDILLWEELENVLKNKPPQDWKYSSGFVNADMMKEHLPLASNDVLIVMCGPPPMTQHPCHPNLFTLGYKTENTFTY